jgi:4-amino-4-deoxy-L-arabinose transferase-like glycosyltransferase
LLIYLLCAVAVSPLLRSISPCTHDGGLHYFRVAAMRHALEEGLFFARWLPDLAFGYGFPFFNYRAPLSYYLGLGLHLTGLPLPLSLNLVYVLSLLGSALGAYLLARDLFGVRAGVVSAVAYAYAPYQLLDALSRGNAPESVALALLPFILWAFRRLALHDALSLSKEPALSLSKGGRGWFLLAVGLLTTLYLGHNISSLLFTPFLLAYLVVLWWVYREQGHWAQTALALGLALGLTAFFWLPALAEKEYVQLYLTGATRGNDFHYNFVGLAEIFAPPAPRDTSLMNPPMEIHLGLVQAVLAGVAVCRWASGMWQRSRGAEEQRSRGAGEQGAGDRERGWMVGFFVLAAAVMIFMSMRPSVWIWENVPLLPFVQFPWRLIGRATLPIALLAGALFSPRTQHTHEARNTPYVSRFTFHILRFAFYIAVIALILAAFPSTYPPAGYCPQAPHPTIEDVHRYEHNSGLVGVDPVGAYFPVWVQKRPKESPLEAQYRADGPVTRFDETVLPDGAEVLDAEYGPNRAWLVVTSPEPFRARYLSFYFLGWRVWVDGDRVDVTPSDPEGLLTFDVPAGRHTVRVRFGETPLRRAADIVSVLCLIGLILYLLSPFIRRLPPMPSHLWLFGGIGAVTVLFLIALSFNVSPYLRGPEEWRWHFGIPGRPERYLIPGLTLAAYVGAVTLWGKRIIEAKRLPRWERYGFLAMLVLSVPLIQASLLATEGPVLEPLFYRTVSPLSNGVFSVGSTINDAGAFLRRYPDLMPTFPVHPQRYPPGLSLLFYLARRLLEHFPGLSDTIGYHLRLYQCHNLTLMRLPNTIIASAVVQMILPIVCGFTVLPIYGLARRALGQRVAVWAAALYPLIPSFNLWFARWDAFYALLAASTWYLFYIGLTERRRSVLMIAGLVLSLATFFSFGVLTLLLPMACWAALWVFTRREHPSWPWLIGSAALFTASLIFPWLLYQLAFGTGFLEIWEVSMSYHLGLKRSYWLWLGYHLYDFFVFLGLPLAMLLLSSLPAALKKLGQRDEVLLPVGFTAGLLLLDLAGVSRGEVARVWLFLTPFAVIAAAWGLSHFYRRRWNFALVALLLAGQLLTFNAFLRVVTTGLEDPPANERSFSPPDIAHPLDARLGQQITLLGYEVQEKEVQPGETVALTLFWQATGPISRTYTVFTHLVGPDGQLAGQQDNMPVAGDWPTTCWMPGEVITDTYELVVTPEFPPGAYTLETGLYTLQTGERLPTRGALAAPDGRVILTTISVEED